MMEYAQMNIVVAAILAAAVPLDDPKATVERYRKILAELRESGYVEKDAKGKVN